MNDALNIMPHQVTDYTYKPRTLEITGHYEKTPGCFAPFAYRGIDAIKLRLDLLTIEEKHRCVGR